MAISTSSPASSTSQDKIEIRALQLPHPLLAPDVWGNMKEQPATLNVILLLHAPFSSASEKDQLDGSTIHYGVLAKTIRAKCAASASKTVADILSAAEAAVYELALKGEGKRFVVKESAVEVDLCKGSMLGSGVVVSRQTEWDEKGGKKDLREGFEAKGVVIPTLIGVNAYERGLKQPLVVTVGLEWRGEGEERQKREGAFVLEREVVNIVQETAYETLETLVEHVYSQLLRKLPQVLSAGTRFRLRMEKPRAIAFADAPVIEIVRTVLGDTPAQSNISSHDALSCVLEKYRGVCSVECSVEACHASRGNLPRMTPPPPTWDRGYIEQQGSAYGTRRRRKTWQQCTPPISSLVTHHTGAHGSAVLYEKLDRWQLVAPAGPAVQLRIDAATIERAEKNYVPVSPSGSRRGRIRGARGKSIETLEKSRCEEARSRIEFATDHHHGRAHPTSDTDSAAASLPWTLFRQGSGQSGESQARWMHLHLHLHVQYMYLDAACDMINSDGENWNGRCLRQSRRIVEDRALLAANNSRTLQALLASRAGARCSFHGGARFFMAAASARLRQPGND
ncbi:hypothetical protein CERZMDRAFT_88630 [Cercospora zeae-maydis SCOH1-5]|uniref:Dihydroneopterin aldolase/epimerase domain-containing protein n=1 Tax=Cercospora zeae-maydis SCOH1-5 TaxID=717836 RepID=A0A6A6EYD2_9PEZI|nr:hypothetical protein CERZMDRAFT_88630 [Cercospora zeae-maydis SCOH1-5]